MKKKQKLVYTDDSKDLNEYMTYFSHVRTLLYGFVHGFFINFPSIQYVLLILIKILLICILIRKKRLVRSFSISVCIFLYYFAGILIDLLCFLSKNSLMPQLLLHNVVSEYTWVNIFELLCLGVICLSVFC